MIEADTKPERRAFTARLAARAEAITKAHAEMRRRSDPWRWRTPRLLWPLFIRER